MSNDKEVTKRKPPENIGQQIRKNAFTILMVIFIGVMFFSPGAKSFVIKQLMATGLFNASVDIKNSDEKNPVSIDFDFVDENGNVQNTSSLRGKVVFINFWASWCPPCRAEFPSIEKLYGKFKNNPNVFFLSINKDKDPTKGKTYLEKEKFSVPMYQSGGHVPTEVYSGPLPTTVVLDKNGKIRMHHTRFADYSSDEFVKQIEELINEQ